MTDLEAKVLSVVCEHPGVVTASVVRRLRPHLPEHVEAALRELRRSGRIERDRTGWAEQQAGGSE